MEGTKREHRLRTVLSAGLCLTVALNGCAWTGFELAKDDVVIQNRITLQSITLRNFNDRALTFTDPPKGYEKLYLVFGIKNESQETQRVEFSQFAVVHTSRPFFPVLSSPPSVTLEPGRWAVVTLLYFFLKEQVPDSVDFAGNQVEILKP